MKRILLLAVLVVMAMSAGAYTRQDTLRGSNGRGRDWWDVTRYVLRVQIDSSTRSIRGRVEIRFKLVGKATDSLQIDLQDPLIIDKISFVEYNQEVAGVLSVNKYLHKEGNVWWITYPFSKIDTPFTSLGLIIDYHGSPREAKNPPWDGGFIWAQDSMQNRWLSVACQGLGSSSWWPCKDFQGDEPDDGMTIEIIDTTDQAFVSNGHFFEENSFWHPSIPDSVVVFGNKYVVRNPINTYNTTFYIGDYTHWHDTLHGEKGVLDLYFYPLRYNEAKARKQWTQAKDMLRCFEYWLGPYPFYEDGYKLVEAPFLGMEHQSAIAYGNQYKNGYYRKTGHIDRSGTGIGFSFDFIIIHESGHEWFGNNITAQDVADNWLHEGFTTYTETLFTEWILGKDSAFRYAQGQWKNIRNDRPVVGDYGVNDDGSGDKYDKGGAVVHMIRLMINDDQKFRQLLRGLNKDFYHKIVTSKQVEDYISKFVGADLSTFFDVYLRSTTKPLLVWSKKGNTMQWHWERVPSSFAAPIVFRDTKGKQVVYNTPVGLMEYDPAPGTILQAAGWYEVQRN